MNLVRRAAQQFGAGLSLSDFDRVLDAMYGGQPSFTGALVSQQNSLAVDAVWACVNGIAGDIANLPFLTYNYTDTSRKPARQHYLWRLLQQEANPELTSFRFKQIMQTWLCLWGNAYAEIEISGRGQVVALWPWRPDRTTVRRRDGQWGPLEYLYRMRDGKVVGPIPADRMLHLRGFSIDGVTGLSPIETHRQTIGLSLAQTEFAGRTYGNGAVPRGVLSHPGKLSPKAEQSLKDSWMGSHQGLANAGRLAILEEGMKYDPISLSPADLAYIEMAGLSDESIARIFNFPQHRIGLLKRATNNNVEQLALEYIQFSLGPLSTNWHQQIEQSLLSAREQQTIMVRPNFRSLLRGDHASMATFIAQLVDRGILNADEVRDEYLDMNPQPDGIGADWWKAMNMSPVSEDNFGKGAVPVQKVTPKGKQPPPDDGGKPNGKVNGLAH